MKAVIQRKIERAIRYTCTTFRKNPHYFLNEHDIKAFLYNRLNLEFNEIPNPREENYVEETSLIHCEIGAQREGKLAYRPDIMILKSDTFKPKFKKDTDMKEWESEYYGVMEIKFNFGDSSKKKLDLLKEDFKQLYRFGEFNLSYVLFFDESDYPLSTNLLTIEDILKIRGSKRRKDNIKIIYNTCGLRKPIIVQNGKESDWIIEQ